MESDGDVEVNVKAIIDVEGIMSDLPKLRPQELKIVGRCVHFRCDKPRDGDAQSPTLQEMEAARRYYEGMVAHITRDTVVLLDAEEFTYKEQVERKQKQQEKNDETGDATTSTSRTVSRAGDPGAGLSTTSGAKDEGGGQSVFASDDDQKKSRKVMPYVTFNRKKIRDVEFAPEDSTRTAQPTTIIPNEQRLRMFVRRYLVHTSVKNNPTNISLKHFIASRTKWSSPNVEVLKLMAEEELDSLIKIDADISKQREARQARAASRDAAATGAAGGGDGDAAARRRAGYNPFGDAGALYNTGIPAKTSYVAVAHLAISITLLLYSAASFSSAEQHIVYGFISSLSTLISIAGAIALFLGGASGYHALKMKFPINSKPMLLRVFFLFGSTAFMLTVSIMMSIALFGFNEPTGGGVSLESFHEDQVQEKPTSVCSFNVKYKCSGYGTACPSASAYQQETHCPPNNTCSTGLLFTDSCEDSIKSQIKDTLLPIVILSYISMFTHALDWLMLYRMFEMVGKLTAARDARRREPV